MINIESFVFNPFMEVTYLVWDENKNTAIIDPGCYDPREKEQLDQFISDNGLKIEKIICTHGHIDHVLGLYHCKTKYNVPVIMHPKEFDVLRAVKSYAPNYGFTQYTEVIPDTELKEASLNVGSIDFEVYFVPGHSPGHIALVNQEYKVCISGDVLFNRSVGRTDLPGGDTDTLMNSIRDVLYKLPDDLVVYPGHGETTTIGEEKQFNPFLIF